MLNTLFRRAVFPITLTTALILSTSACSGGDSAVAEDCAPAHPGLTTVTEGTLTIGVSDMPPQSSTTGDNGYSGLDADIIDGFAAVECLTVAPMTGQSSAMVPGVEQGRWDTALGGWYRTAVREEIVSMGAPLYLDQFAFIGAEEYPTVDSLEGLRIGTVDGYNFVSDIQAIFGDAITLYPSALNMAQDYEAGRIDVAIDAIIAAPATFGDDVVITVPEPDERIAASVEPAQCSLPFIKSNPELLAAFDAYVAQIKEDGTLAEILARYDLPASIADTGDPYLV